MNRLKPLQIFLIALVVLVLGGLVFYTVQEKPGAPAVTFTSLKGEKITMESLRGKVVLVNFWATSCPGCVEEMPKLVDTYRKHHDAGLELVAVAMSYDPPNYVLNYTEKNQLPFPVALDVQGDLSRAFGDVKLTPTTFIIDKQGHIIQQTLGALDFGKLDALLARELAPTGS